MWRKVSTRVKPVIHPLWEAVSRHPRDGDDLALSKTESLSGSCGPERTAFQHRIVDPIRIVDPLTPLRLFAVFSPHEIGHCRCLLKT